MSIEFCWLTNGEIVCLVAQCGDDSARDNGGCCRGDVARRAPKSQRAAVRNPDEGRPARTSCASRESHITLIVINDDAHALSWLARLRCPIPALVPVIMTGSIARQIEQLVRNDSAPASVEEFDHAATFPISLHVIASASACHTSPETPYNAPGEDFLPIALSLPPNLSITA